MKNQPKFNADTMLLLTDGTVMCHQVSSPKWYRLTADSNGDYETAGAAWTDMAPLAPLANGTAYGPLYFASAVLGNGNVFVAGGEDNNGAQVEVAEVQVYNT